MNIIPIQNRSVVTLHVFQRQRSFFTRFYSACRCDLAQPKD